MISILWEINFAGLIILVFAFGMILEALKQKIIKQTADKGE